MVPTPAKPIRILRPLTLDLPLGEFAEEISEMHTQVREALEEQASATTGLLTMSQRAPLVEEWVKRFEIIKFREEDR